jgi:hypothetical protein
VALLLERATLSTNRVSEAQPLFIAIKPNLTHHLHDFVALMASVD